ncbi:C4b-binding protein alpha chain-like isoform X2 [Carcharodon carcharias]|uniref:C4b-binding protein alpha chain-like isoform X2 n=1 Tax=Carcharodon carcharias TaxID=13397 RepID=UPI001B7DB130|nr:C4b-binding protein alpha chain-like isoform X2 [Carcharodon carcharias]
MAERLILALMAIWVARVTGDCGKPPQLANGDLSDEFHSQSSFPVGARVLYKCYPGYIIAGLSRFITCEAGSVWGRLLITCEPRNCGNPGEINNGYYTETNTTLGSKVTFYCAAGYQMVGRNYRICTADGWDGQVPTCDPVTCKDLEPISNGITPDPPSGDFWTFGMIARYSCINDYSLIGADQLVCNVSGEWDKKPPICKDVKCKRSKISATLEIVSGFGPIYKYRQQITFRCIKGYEMVGSSTIECSENNTFVPSPPICRPRTAATTAVPAATTVPATTTAEGEPENQTGKIVGIILGVVLLAAVVLVIYCCKKKKEGQYTTSEKVAMNPQSEQVQVKPNLADH